MTLSIRYHFNQRFTVSAKRAFNWCTSFESKDHVLMGEERAERYIAHVTDSTIVLKDVFSSMSGQIEKQKLVQLYPGKLSWTSTHLTGPNKYSQFLYVISPKGKNTSVLDFTGLHLDYEEKALDKADIKLLARRLCKDDSNAWKLLAKAMAKELGK